MNPLVTWRPSGTDPSPVAGALPLGGRNTAGLTYAEHSPAERRGFWTAGYKTTANHRPLFVSLLVIVIKRRYEQRRFLPIGAGVFRSGYPSSWWPFRS